MRKYLAVNADIDCTGYMQPRTVTWKDGRRYQIEQVQSLRQGCSPVGRLENTDCYAVVIRGQTRFLYFERPDPRFVGRFGRWYVEVGSENEPESWNERGNNCEKL